VELASYDLLLLSSCFISLCCIAITKTREGLAISDITLLELITLTSKGRIRLDISLESFLGEIETRFIVLPISGRVFVRALGLPAAYPTRDPAVAGSAHNLVRTANLYCASIDTRRLTRISLTFLY
jgi:hypothetical protein